MLLGFLDSRGQGVLLALARGHRLATDSSSLQKGDANLQTLYTWVIGSKQRGSTGSGVSRVLRYWKEVRVILSTDRGMVVLRLYKGDEELRGAMIC